VALKPSIMPIFDISAVRAKEAQVVFVRWRCVYWPTTSNK
jgi:hypothetical protein